MKTIEQKIDECYNELFNFICQNHDDLYDLVIEYKEETTGKTIRRSWREREKILQENNNDN